MLMIIKNPDYEKLRLDRYKDLKQPRYNYTHNDLISAFEAWAQAGSKRDDEWDTYCDIRDGVPEGTNADLRKKWRTVELFHH